VLLWCGKEARMGFWKRFFGGGRGRSSPPAFAENQGAQVRDAGPQAMRDPPSGWSKTDEEGDESFPASDPPGDY
jgi:hypothetical protein